MEFLTIQCVTLWSGFAIEKVVHIDPSLAVIYRSFAQLIVYGLIGIWTGMEPYGVPGERIYVFGRCFGGFFSFTLGVV